MFMGALGLSNARFGHDDGLVFAGGTRGEFQALYVELGKLLWNFQTLLAGVGQPAKPRSRISLCIRISDKHIE